MPFVLLPPLFSSFYQLVLSQIKAIEGIKQHPDYENLKISYGKDRCGGAPRAFRGFDLRNQQRGANQNNGNGNGHSSNDVGSPDLNGYPHSPFTDPMSFPTSPAQHDGLHLADSGLDQSTNLPEIGALELDEEAAAAAQGGNGNGQA